MKKPISFEVKISLVLLISCYEINCELYHHTVWNPLTYRDYATILLKNNNKLIVIFQLMNYNFLGIQNFNEYTSSVNCSFIQTKRLVEHIKN